MTMPPPPDEVPPHYYTYLGLITYTWAIIETTLDFQTSICFQGLGGDKIRRKLPRHPEQSVAFLKRCCDDLPPLQPFKEKILALLERIENVETDRHFYVHAIAGDALRKIVRTADIYGTETRKLDLMEMQMFAAKLVLLSQDMAFHVRDDLVPLVRQIK
jgi:hypothetical protein